MSGTGLPQVAIWRDLWLEPSQTFIRDQCAALTRWQPVRVGLQAEPVSIQTPDVVAAPAWLPRRLLWPLTYPARPLPHVVHRLRKARVQLLHAHFGPDAIHALPYARALKVPMLVSFHGYDVTQLVTGDSPAVTSYLVRLRQVFAQASRLIAVSEFIAGRLIALGAPADKVVVCPIGLPLLELPALTQDRDGIVFVGRLVPKKGVDDLLAAVALLPDELRRTRVTIIGYGPLHTELADRARSSGLNVELRGRQPSSEVARAMQQHAVFCAPSKTSAAGDAEGFGIVFLEAAAQGAPSVSYRHGGVPEAVLDGVTGLLADEGDVAGLSSALRALLVDPGRADSLGRAGRQRVAAEFDIRRRTAVLEQLYDEVTGGAAGLPGARR